MSKYEAAGVTIDVRGGLLVVSKGHGQICTLRSEHITRVTTYGALDEQPGVTLYQCCGTAFSVFGELPEVQEGDEVADWFERINVFELLMLDAFTRAMLESLNFKRG